MLRKIIITMVLGGMLCISGQLCGPGKASAETAAEYSLLPPFVAASEPPLVMLVLGRDHKLYYEAYNDASDLNGDGVLDVGYNPDIDYYGYFDSYKCYTYSNANERFEPTSTASTGTKHCNGASEWSGDFLNYLTMSRMDAMRKVLYGGYRSTDAANETVLQRAYIPQDAHTWGKEYESVARDGYNISLYTPLSQPQTGTYHLFACTTLSDNGDPLLRVLPNNVHRIWEWVAKERPVADNEEETPGGVYNDYPDNHQEYNELVMLFGNAGHLQGSGPPASGQINGTGNPYGADDYYLTLFTGFVSVTAAGTYEFAVDGDAAVEVIIDGEVIASWYGYHSGKCDCQTHKGSVDLTAGDHIIEFRHQERTGDDNYYLWWNGPDSGGLWEIVPPAHYTDLIQSVYDVETTASTITDYKVRVKVCDPSMPENNCKEYPSGALKPVGLLQKHGESGRMYFGLMTGSYAKNTSGGVLRKNIGPITDEIDPDTGQFTNVNGIISTMDKLRVVGFDYADYTYDQNCGWITTRSINEGECRMWGNPIGEMMYETLRYFSGGSATSAFTYSGTTDDSTLGLPLATWEDPYANYNYCAQPFMLVISDIVPSYDSDQLPGSYFGAFGGSLGSMNVESLADTISSHEGISGNYYIGQRGASYDTACTPKNVSTLGDIRGLCPEEPTKGGGYYSASVAYYGLKEDIHATANGDQNVSTFAVGLASPLPRIEIPVADKTVTLVPFAKSCGGCMGPYTSFQPTNTIVDFFVEQITPTYGRFRINFEDVEQGADHDMDAIVIYEYQLNANNTVTITLTSEYAAGCIIQHLGFIISGTTADGTYLEVRDRDTGSSDDVDYLLDTPPGQGPGGTWNDGTALPLITSRTFSAGTTAAATLLTNPLWYAAKWGGFEDQDGDDIPEGTEWDEDGNGVPDNYFYVQNPLRLEEQLNEAFFAILAKVSSGTAASVISSTRSGEGAVYQAIFFPIFGAVAWAGEVHALLVDAYGNMREDTNGNDALDLATDRIVVFEFEDTNGNGQADYCETKVYKYEDTNENGQIDASETPVSTMCLELFEPMTDLAYLWSAAEWLNEIPDADIVNQRTFGSSSAERYIFTFLDADQDMVPDVDEIVDFVSTNWGQILPFIHLYPPFENIPDWVPFNPPYVDEDPTWTPPADYADFLEVQSQRVIDFIRGNDQGDYQSATYGYTIPSFRSRQADYDKDNDDETWRMGDVVYATPTIVGPPAEDLDLLYKDASYGDFYRQYKDRRQMLYAGGNDAQFHALNAGFYNARLTKFFRGMDRTCVPEGDVISMMDTCPTGTVKACGAGEVPRACFSDTGPALGAEMWAYVPYNLLPHIYWLTEQGYDGQVHVNYVDLKPKVFDAKIFPDDSTHPHGWGTVLVGGMGFGGGKIRADIDKDNFYDNNDRTMGSAFFIMDITDPEQPPTLLAEIASEDLGFTTCYPTVIVMKDKDPANDDNNWYLVLGSGPNGPSGPDTSALADGDSTETAKIFLLDLKALVATSQIKTLASDGSLQVGLNVFAELDADSFVSDPISVDLDLDYKIDAVYFGTVSGDDTAGWGGKLRRIVVDDDPAPANWTRDSTLIDLTNTPYGTGQPIVAAPTMAKDEHGQVWVFFGTGRFYNRQDAANTDQQSFYGIKEPLDSLTGGLSWSTVSRSNLLDVSDVVVIEGSDTVENIMSQIASKDGWLIDFPETGERNLGQAALLGDILTFSTYIPSDDVCKYEGESYLWALYFSTGTANGESVIGTQEGEGGTEVVKTKSLGQGLTITPNVHTGRQKGAKVFIQTSTGAILVLQQENPGAVKSGRTAWTEWQP